MWGMREIIFCGIILVSNYNRKVLCWAYLAEHSTWFLYSHSLQVGRFLVFTTVKYINRNYILLNVFILLIYDFVNNITITSQLNFNNIFNPAV